MNFGPLYCIYCETKNIVQHIEKRFVHRNRCAQENNLMMHFNRLAHNQTAAKSVATAQVCLLEWGRIFFVEVFDQSTDRSMFYLSFR